MQLLVIHENLKGILYVLAFLCICLLILFIYRKVQNFQIKKKKLEIKKQRFLRIEKNFNQVIKKQFEGLLKSIANSVTQLLNTDSYERISSLTEAAKKEFDVLESKFLALKNKKELHHEDMNIFKEEEKKFDLTYHAKLFYQFNLEIDKDTDEQKKFDVSFRNAGTLIAKITKSKPRDYKKFVTEYEKILGDKIKNRNIDLATSLKEAAEKLNNLILRINSTYFS